MKQVTAYQTTDGKLFISEVDASKHESTAAVFMQMRSMGIHLTAEQREQLEHTIIGSTPVTVAAPPAKEPTALPVTNYSPAGAGSAPTAPATPVQAPPTPLSSSPLPSGVPAPPMGVSASPVPSPPATPMPPVTPQPATIPAVPAAPKTGAVAPPGFAVGSPASTPPQPPQQEKPSASNPLVHLSAGPPSGVPAPTDHLVVGGDKPIAPPSMDLSRSVGAPPVSPTNIVDTSVANSVAGN